MLDESDRCLVEDYEAMGLNMYAAHKHYTTARDALLASLAKAEIPGHEIRIEEEAFDLIVSTEQVPVSRWPYPAVSRTWELAAGSGAGLLVGNYDVQQAAVAFCVGLAHLQSEWLKHWRMQETGPDTCDNVHLVWQCKQNNPRAGYEDSWPRATLTFRESLPCGVVLTAKRGCRVDKQGLTKTFTEVRQRFAAAKKVLGEFP